MNQKSSDQGWQQLQANIEGFVGQALRNNIQRIEYNPLFITHLLEMTSERYQNEPLGAMAISDNFNEKGRET